MITVDFTKIPMPGTYAGHELVITFVFDDQEVSTCLPTDGLQYLQDLPWHDLVDFLLNAEHPWRGDVAALVAFYDRDNGKEFQIAYENRFMANR